MVPQIANFLNSFPLVLGRKMRNIFPWGRILIIKCNFINSLTPIWQSAIARCHYTFVKVEFHEKVNSFEKICFATGQGFSSNSQNYLCGKYITTYLCKMTYSVCQHDCAEVSRHHITFCEINCRPDIIQWQINILITCSWQTFMWLRNFMIWALVCCFPFDILFANGVLAI